MSEASREAVVARGDAGRAEGPRGAVEPLSVEPALAPRPPDAPQPPDMTRLLVGLVGVAIVIITLLTITAILAGPPAG